MEYVDCFGQYQHFNNICSSYPGSWNLFPFFYVSSSISFISFLQFLAYESFTSLVRFIPRYFMGFGAIINGINSLISLSVASLLVYRNATDFCTLILYPATLLNSCISASSFLVASYEFSMQNIMLSVKSESLTSLLIQISFRFAV